MRTDLKLYLRVLGEVRGYWWHIAAILFVGLLATPLALLGPVPLKIAVDSVLGSEPLPAPVAAAVPSSLQTDPGSLLLLAALLVILLKILSRMQRLALDMLKTYTSESLVLRFQAKMFQHAQTLPLGYHDSSGSADSIYRIQSDAGAIRQIAVNSVLPFVTNVVTLVAMILVSAKIDWQLALVALVVVPSLTALTYFYRPRMRAQWRDVKTVESSSLAVVQEVLSNLRVVKAFVQEDREQDRFKKQYGRGMRLRLRTVWLQGGFWTLVSLTTAIGTALVMYLGVRHVQMGTLTLGSLLLVMSYLGQMYAPLSSISERVTALQKSLASAERAYTLLDEPRDVPDRANGRRIVRAVGAIEFGDVSFGYGSDSLVLRNLSFRVEAGDRVGIIGRTGVGKTTLAGLLLRFYDPMAGEILLDGVDAREYRLDDLRRQFAVVMQEPSLFHTSIRDNISYGRPEASDAEVAKAARAANVHDVIMGLPNGYDTLVGEGGMRLSGGERQRVSLARAFVKDAPVLILDEPTSSVDIGTEGAILDAMDRLMEGRTTFIIAHRLSTLESCDLLIHMTSGTAELVEGDVKVALQRAQAAGSLQELLA